MGLINGSDLLYSIGFECQWKKIHECEELDSKIVHAIILTSLPDGIPDDHCVGTEWLCPGQMFRPHASVSEHCISVPREAHSLWPGVYRDNFIFVTVFYQSSSFPKDCLKIITTADTLPAHGIWTR